MALRQWNLGILAAGAALLSLSATAGAVPVVATPGSEINIFFNGVTVENPGTVGSGDLGTGGSCNLLTGCAETTWGVGFVSHSNDVNTSKDIYVSSASERIAFVLYGIADKSITANLDGSVTINNTGATDTSQFAAADGKIHLDLYYYSGDNPCFSTSAECVKPGDRTGFGTVTGITDIVGASLFAALELVPGISPDSDVTLNQVASVATAPAHGGGSFYADCVSGPGCDQFKKDAFLSNDFLSDLFAKFSFTETSGSIETAGWQENISDPANAFGVPEPASLALLGSALAFFGVAVRRRRKGMSA